MKLGTIKRRRLDDCRDPLETSHKITALGTTEYEIVFNDESPSQMLTANTTAQNVFSQINNDSYYIMCLKEITGYEKTEEAVSNPQEHETHTTIGWSLRVLWANQSPL